MLPAGGDQHRDCPNNSGASTFLSFFFFSFYTMRGEQRAVRRSYRVALPGPPTTATVGFVRSQQTPDERIISGEQGGREKGGV